MTEFDAFAQGRLAGYRNLPVPLLMSLQIPMDYRGAWMRGYEAGQAEGRDDQINKYLENCR